jgi:hypothetical protein
MTTEVSASLRQRLSGSLDGMKIDEVPGLVRQILGQIEINFFLLGLIYNYVVTHALAEDAGYKDAPDFFAKEVKDLSRSTLAAYGAVAREFSQEQGVQYGVSRLTLLLTYEEASGQKADRNDPGLFPITVGEKDGKPQEKSFASCTVADLRAALQRLRRPTSSAPIPETDMAVLKDYRTSVANKFSDKKNHIQISARNDKGTTLMTVQDIPLTEVPTFIAALTAVAMKTPN